MNETEDFAPSAGSYYVVPAVCVEDGIIVVEPGQNKQYIGLHLDVEMIPKKKKWYAVLEAPREPDLNWSDFLNAARNDAAVQLLIAKDTSLDKNNCPFAYAKLGRWVLKVRS